MGKPLQEEGRGGREANALRALPNVGITLYIHKIVLFLLNMTIQTSTHYSKQVLDAPDKVNVDISFTDTHTPASFSFY